MGLALQSNIDEITRFCQKLQNRQFYCPLCRLDFQ